jgi:hypothetical protein
MCFSGGCTNNWHCRCICEKFLSENLCNCQNEGWGKADKGIIREATGRSRTKILEIV